MKFIESLQSKEIKERNLKTKFVLFGFVLVLALLYLVVSTVKVSALDISSTTKTVTGTKYKKDGTNIGEYGKVDLTTANGQTITFIQGNGKDDEVAIKFTIDGVPSSATSIAFVEPEHSDSTNGDLDRYSRTVDGWENSDEGNPVKNGIIGSVTVDPEDADKIYVVYRLRLGGYGMKFLKVYFYSSDLDTCTEESGCAASIEVWYVISQPVDAITSTVNSKNCSTVDLTSSFCIQYDTDKALGRTPNDLYFYLPDTVAYDFKVQNISEAIQNNNYKNANLNTIYAINYFTEANGEVSIVQDVASANRSYLYTNFTLSGDDTTDTAGDLEVPFMNFRNTYEINKIAYLSMKVDATGTYFFYITDIFGNVSSDVKQVVENVKNRTIYTEITKDNRTGDLDAWGFDDAETFTNKSVGVTLKMTVETKFEYGTCLDGKCATVTKLDSTNVKYIKYWRVDVKIENGVDRDAYVDGDPVTKQYASESYAYNNAFYYLVCKDGCPNGVSIQTYSRVEADQTSPTNAGFDSFSDNVLKMYIATSGRYRFYIEDTYGNDTWGEAGSLVEMEYRNPRVEVYAIDKYAPEITFDQDDDNVKNVEGTELKIYDIETFKYYQGVDSINDSMTKTEKGFQYDGRMVGAADAGNITGGIYYPVDRDAGRDIDEKFTDDIAILESKVKATEQVVYYGNTKDTFSDYYVYGDREGDDTPNYDTKDYDNGRINTISKNTQHNSNGLKGEESFEFKITYYHYDGKTKICDYLKTVEGYSDYGSKAQLDCVNYYLDHGVDFIIEFGAEDKVGNVGYSKIYVNVIDTTTAGFILPMKDNAIDTTKTVKRSNIGTNCRMEVGSEIGVSNAKQGKQQILDCYNVIVDNAYNFEDNVYGTKDSPLLSYSNTRVAKADNVKVSILSDVDNTTWIDLSVGTFIPNETGYHDMKIEIFDNTPGATGTNVLTVLVSYYVDKKIVLIQPLAQEKFYGDDDPTINDQLDSMFHYCVYINQTNDYDSSYFDNPYEDMDVYSVVYCTTNTAEQITAGKAILFRNNVGTSDFGGELTRLESIWYNEHLSTALGATSNTPIKDDNGVGVENNYVGLYNIILGTLNINTTDEDDDVIQDKDYVVKIHPTYRTDTKYGGQTNDNKIVQAAYFEDDLPYAESKTKFTIKQVVLKVSANGGNKNYGDVDTNSDKYNNDKEKDNPYLGGYTVDADGLKYTDTASVVLGVLRRKVGENVGRYLICNYRGTTLDDNVRETTNNMYLNCNDTVVSGVAVDEDTGAFIYEYIEGGLIKMNANYIASRALYIEPNKTASGKTLNVAPNDTVRNNTYANYVIEYTNGSYVINAIDLVLQAAPGQRREYSKINYDPNPWEIILYGLVDGKIKRTAEDDPTFNGYTANILEGETEYYGISKKLQKDDEDVDEEHPSKLDANASEEREDGWKLIHNGVELQGYKTNETYNLLRSTALGSSAGSAKLTRESGMTGGWYLYNVLGNDKNIEGIAEERSNVSTIAVVTNINNNCSYVDSTGHKVAVNGNLPCKNYNLVYNPYYTNEDGYTIDTMDESKGHEAEDFIYKSGGENRFCTTADIDIPCENTVEEPKKIYKIQFEIYRREIIMEFNSAIETIELAGTDFYDIVYGKRYNFFKNSYFDIEFYDGTKKHNNVTILPEDYLFVCYQNMSTKSNFTKGDASTGCTGDYRYGLVQNDTWSNIGLKFWMHTDVSSESSNYYDNDDSAIPAGVYYIYADIKEEEKLNYKFTYLGGALTIKSKTVNVKITSYQKEYGEVYYSKFGSGSEYSGFTSYASECFNDGLIINSNDSLINVNCNPSNEALNTGNEVTNTYGFIIEGLDAKDTIANNFSGRPKRDRSTSMQQDTNGLQDDVGIYEIKQGSISSKNANPFISGNKSCSTFNEKDESGNVKTNCVVVSGKAINNYVISGETRNYTFDMTIIDDVTSTTPIIGTPSTTMGSLFITPATLTITVTTGQTKMYGCAYNSFNTDASKSTYSYENGYSNCVEIDGNHYDLGYKYVVSGDKDYQIANNGYNYTSSDSYEVSGILGDASFRPTTKTYGIKAHALNDEGTLYRIPDTSANRTGVTTSTYYTAAVNAQLQSSKTYQQQTVGNYILTLGNVDAMINNGHANLKNTCDANNMPSAEGGYACKNYHINYYGTHVNPTNLGADEDKQTYKDGEDFPAELIFTITARKAYVYTDYDLKIYGDEDQKVSYLCGDYNMDGKVDDDDNIEGVNGDIVNGFCYSEQVSVNKDADTSNDVKVDYGLTRYYTKYNSLAKAPWNGLGTRNDVQYDVVGGLISRQGMVNTETGEREAPQTNDIRGFYPYVYNSSKYGATVALKEYGAANYTINFYNESGVAVNKDGKTQNEDGEKKLIQFEIVLRQIKIALVSFDKVYGEHDNVEDYDILVCAPTDTFDFTNMKCIPAEGKKDPHGLSKSHLEDYTEDGKLIQEKFKEDFIVRYKRVLGENVSCGTSSNVAVTLNGYFFGSTDEVNTLGTEYSRTLKCDSDKGYETLAYIDQTEQYAQRFGYNYQVSYTTGHVNIVKRNILITPDAGQGFTYGDYYDTLIPSITYTDSLDTTNTTLTTRQTYGLVHGESGEGVCLKNINYYNNGDAAGTCFYINDRKDEYNSGNSKNTSSYDEDAVNADTGLSGVNVKNFVFGDVYASESSARSALNRSLGGSDNQRYNRNVGLYDIVLGDLTDQTGNYEITFKTGVKYTISSAALIVTPKDKDATYSSVTQYKIYGEQDKELTFDVVTKYNVKYSHFAKLDSSIISVCPSVGDCIDAASLDKYSYDATNDKFDKIADGTYIYLVAGDTVSRVGYAYGENGADSSRNYGISKQGNKPVIGTDIDEEVNQGSVEGSKYYDTVCKDKPENIGCIDRTLSYGDTNRILLGYLYVEDYSQAAGTYAIVSGLKEAINEFGKNNYAINFTSNVTFTIIPRPIGVQIENVSKTYGQTTDKISCEYVEEAMIENCAAEDGILDANSEGYLRYNFNVEHFSGSTRIDSILGSNSGLYSQNSTFVNGLVPDSQKAYSQYGVEEKKNSNHLGVYVSRDEKNINSANCMYNGDTYGFCEDVGTYYLRFYGYYNTIDNISKHSYQSVYKLTASGYSGAVSSVSEYYYNMYFGYNPNYFVIVVESDTIEDTIEDETAVTSSSLFASNVTSTARTPAEGSTEKLLKATGTLTINKKKVNLFVNTNGNFLGDETTEIYYIQQNSNPPRLPLINNDFDLKYEEFSENREEAVGGANTYGKVIWGRHPNQVRTGDKLYGELAYCNVIISSSDYSTLYSEGLASDYNCASENLIYVDNKNSLDTQLEGYVPIVRSTSTLSIVNQSSTTANANYENNNYEVRFYPGALRIDKDDTAPVVQINRPDVYIEANAVGDYLYECVATNKTTTYVDCDLGGSNISVVGKTELVAGDPILSIFNEVDEDGRMFYYEKDGTKHYADTIVKGQLPTLDTCGTEGGYPCTAAAYYQFNYGKGKTNFVSSGGIIAGQESTLVEPFTMQKSDYINNKKPASLKELIITLVDWFGVTAYDAGEVRNGELLDKKFDKYWYVVIESEGTNGSFNIGKVGKYTVHFYVMDNAGNVSKGNMYDVVGEGDEETEVLQDDYTNVGTLHIIDTTKPVVGTMNLYNGKVVCLENDCTIESNWTVAQDTYLSVNTLGRYDDEGNPSSSGEYVIIDKATNMVKLSTLDRYTRTVSALGEITYKKDADQGKYIKIAQGASALALKHYSWTNSPVGIYMTITGGSDNSYSEVSFPSREAIDNSQWNHYFSRDGGITWFLYDRTNKDGYLALDAEGTREIMIKAVDSGVKINTSTKGSSTYVTKYYGDGNANNQTATMDKYTFTDSSVNDDWLKEFALMSTDDQKTNDTTRHEKVGLVGWNISDAAEDDTAKASIISKLIYGKDTDDSGYKFYRDKQMAYLDRTNPSVSFGTGNGKDIYIFEYGCDSAECTKGYKEYYAGVKDSYPTEYSSREVASGAYDKNNSIFINHSIFVQGEGSKYQGSYTNISQETLSTKSDVGGLGNDMYAMNGSDTGTDIRNIYTEERRYIIYAFDENNNRTVYDLSDKIPTSTSSTDGEEDIYSVILSTIPENYSAGDYTYSIIYSVIDKAGNESVYIARGVIFADLTPEIEVQSPTGNVEEVEENVYMLNVKQGDDVNEIVNSLSVVAGTKTENKLDYLTQTIYYNGEQITGKEMYNPLISEAFNTNNPGVYEIVYNLSYLYESEGEYKLIHAKPVTLVINIEATPPKVAETSENLDYSNIITLMSVLLGAMFICFVCVVNKRRI